MVKKCTCTKVHNTCAEPVFCELKLFLTFSLMSLSSLLKVPIIFRYTSYLSECSLLFSEQFPPFSVPVSVVMVANPVLRVPLL